MPAKYQIYKDNAGKYRFRLTAENNRIVAVGEAYSSHASCLNGVKSVKKNYGAEIEDSTVEGQKIPNPKYQIFRDKSGQFRFHLKASNGEIIAVSEAYETKEGALDGISVVKKIGNAKTQDLTVNGKVPKDDSGKTELAPTPAPVEPKIEASVPIAKVQEPEPIAPIQPAPATSKSDEKVKLKSDVSNMKTYLISIFGIFAGIVIIAFGLGFGNFGAVFGGSEDVAKAAVLIVGALVLGLSLAFFVKKKCH
jgi:uncharacterized protein YegP (UPF0339 family)